MARPARAVDDGHGLVLGRRGLLGRRFRRRFGRMRGRGSLLIGDGRLAQRNVGDRLAAKRIVVEQSEADEGDQEQPEQHGERLHRRKRQPEPALLTRPVFCPSGVLSSSAASAMDLPESAAPTIPRGGRFQRRADGARQERRYRPAKASESRKQKGRPEDRPFRENRRLAISSRPCWPAVDRGLVAVRRRRQRGGGRP